MKIRQNCSVGKHLIEINLAMILISTSGTFGRYIAMEATTTIWLRAALAAILLFVYCRLRGFSLKIQSRKDFAVIAIGAVLLGAHWVFYFMSLQMTNVAIGMLTLFTFPLFATLLEPIFYQTGWSVRQLLSCGMILIGLYILVPSTDIDGSYLNGILLGLLSALCFTLRNLVLKPQTSRYQGSVIMAFQLAILAVTMIPLQLEADLSQSLNFIWPLLFLALFTTVIGHTMFLASFRYFSIATASILASLQPVYGILIALVFLGEVPTGNSLIGGALILGTVVVSSMGSLSNKEVPSEK